MAQTADHEAKLRILIGSSSFDERACTIWTREGQNEPPKKYRRYTTRAAKEIHLPLGAKQVIIADSDRHRHPQPVEGEIFVISKGQHGWMVNGALIAEQRGFMPLPLASRDLHFDIVSARAAAAVRHPRRRERVLQFPR